MRVTDSAFDSYFTGLEESERAVALRIRDAVREAVGESPRVTETTKWNYPAWVHEGKRGNMCSIMSAQGYVRLQFFRGAELPNSEQRLEGTGKGMRHLKVWCNQGFPDEEIRSLVSDAIKLHGGSTQGTSA